MTSMEKNVKMFYHLRESNYFRKLISWSKMIHFGSSFAGGEEEKMITYQRSNCLS